jgi:sulfur carrier protein
MKLTVNGDTLTLNGNTIADLVSQLELTGRRLAVEVNREIIPKSQHSESSTPSAADSTKKHLRCRHRLSQ